MAQLISTDAGRPLPESRLIDPEKLVKTYYAAGDEASQAAQPVAFGTSGHRGSALRNSFNEPHILAIAQAICDYRVQRRGNGPLFLGRDTHALSEPAFRTAVEVFAANDVLVMVDSEQGFTPTPAISHAILRFNIGRSKGFADGVVVTPSHNPPEDGGIKYNPPHGGPAEPEAASVIERRANQLLGQALSGVRRMPYERAVSATRPYDYRSAYVADLRHVLDLDAVSAADVNIGIDPLGGASLSYWPAIIDQYRLNALVVSDIVDPRFGFMPADWDGKIRMDCSSPYAMAALIRLKDQFTVAFGNDPDADRHGIVTAAKGLVNPNHFLAAAAAYLFTSRNQWPPACAVGKTMVTSALLDRLAASLGRPLRETPVGFRWFVDDLLDGRLGFAGEESAGASFLRRDGTVWTTEKDGMVLGLLAAEIAAISGRDPGELFADLTRDLGTPYYERIDAPASAELRAMLKRLSPADLTVEELAGEKVLAVETTAPGTGAPLGGVRVRARNGWFAARPSGTEEIYKIYAESFVDPAHLRQIQAEAQALIAALLGEAEARRSPGDEERNGSQPS